MIPESDLPYQKHLKFKVIKNYVNKLYLNVIELMKLLLRSDEGRISKTFRLGIKKRALELGFLLLVRSTWEGNNKPLPVEFSLQCSQSLHRWKRSDFWSVI